MTSLWMDSYEALKTRGKKVLAEITTSQVNCAKTDLKNAQSNLTASLLYFIYDAVQFTMLP